MIAEGSERNHPWKARKSFRRDVNWIDDGAIINSALSPLMQRKRKKNVASGIYGPFFVENPWMGKGPLYSSAMFSTPSICSSHLVQDINFERKAPVYPSKFFVQNWRGKIYEFFWHLINAPGKYPSDTYLNHNQIEKGFFIDWSSLKACSHITNWSKSSKYNFSSRLVTLRW